MTDGEVFAFMDVLKTVTRVFPIRGTEHDVHEVGMAYFKALKRYPLERVSAGADACIAHGKGFPKPRDWEANIPRGIATTIDVPVMTAEEARQWHRADALRYEDTPCRCRECVHAGIDDKPIRYVPEFTENDNDRKVKDPHTDKIVTAGHWAHGAELARWYRAKEAFWTQARAAIKQHSMPATTGYTKPRTTQQRIDASFARLAPVEDREPGSDDE